MVLRLHRTIGLILILFIALHFGTHFRAAAGPEPLAKLLDLVRPLYRGSVTEPLLLAGLLAQVLLGTVLAARRLRRGVDRGWGIAQLASGLYLGMFIVLHAGSALFARNVNHLDTNFWWPASTLAHASARYFFYPYYTLAILAVFTHLAAALRFRGAPRILVWVFLLSSLPVAWVVLSAYGSEAYRHRIPEPYMDALDRYSAVGGARRP